MDIGADVLHESTEPGSTVSQQRDAERFVCRMLRLRTDSGDGGTRDYRRRRAEAGIPEDVAQGCCVDLPSTLMFGYSLV